MLAHLAGAYNNDIHLLCFLDQAFELAAVQPHSEAFRATIQYDRSIVLAADSDQVLLVHGTGSCQFVELRAFLPFC